MADITPAGSVVAFLRFQNNGSSPKQPLPKVLKEEPLPIAKGIERRRGLIYRRI